MRRKGGCLGALNITTGIIIWKVMGWQIMFPIGMQYHAILRILREKWKLEYVWYWV
jgi:hypothetical protein